MEFKYQYRIMYESGQTYDRSHIMVVDISKEDYKKIIQGVLNGTPIKMIEDIQDVIEEMTENVLLVDRYDNVNGSRRKTPLKKPRNISELDFFLEKSEYLRIKRMENPLEVLERPREQMTIYRYDGSSVMLSSENGLVELYDPRNKGRHIIFEADHFLSRLL